MTVSLIGNSPTLSTQISNIPSEVAGSGSLGSSALFIKSTYTQDHRHESFVVNYIIYILYLWSVFVFKSVVHDHLSSVAMGTLCLIQVNVFEYDEESLLLKKSFYLRSTVPYNLLPPRLPLLQHTENTGVHRKIQCFLILR